jgi:methionyl-tRNA formyltransferase
MMFNSVLFFGRSKCLYTKKIRLFLQKKTLNFQYIESKKYGEKFDINCIKYQKFDFIFSFRSFFILKKNLLNKCLIAAINFHPGPPEYRGIGCINYALYENSKFYGCTAHIMNNKIDNGSIIDVKKFKIIKSDTVETCLKKTHILAYNQAIVIFKSLLKEENFLNKSIKKNKHLCWSKNIKNKKDLDNFYKIDLGLSKNDINRKIRATYTANHKPYIILNGRSFFLK